MEGNDVDVDTIRIVVATDSHVGYNEKHKVRGNDALNTFEEVFQIARRKKGDLILHGGDLFHDNKPSRNCLHRTMELFRRYCFGPGAVNINVVSDPSVFSRGLVNFEDPNINVEMPVFMIHGNHDDPGGESNLCAGNLLEVSGMINCFGRQENLEDIVIRPILIRKGATQLAIYGLGNIRDERLNRAFTAGKVRFETPPDPQQWFNLMILHQNRYKGNKGGVPSKSCILEDMLPVFLDLVIWGHEHDCEVVPKRIESSDFYLIQPGSSVATSLTAGEAGRKHIGVIDVRLGDFRCIPQELYTVRPIVIRDLVLSATGLQHTDAAAIMSRLVGEVESMIAEGELEIRTRRQNWEAAGGLQELPGLRRLEMPTTPLIRLRVEHSGFEVIAGQAFGQQFGDRVANPDELLLFHRKTGAAGGGGTRKLPGVGDMLEIEDVAGSSEGGVKIQDILYRYIEGEKNLQILSEPDLNDAVQSYVHRSEACAIERFVKESVEMTCLAVLQESRAVGEDEIRVQIKDRAEHQRQQRLAGTPNLQPSLAPVPGAPEAKLELKQEAKQEPAEDDLPHDFMPGPPVGVSGVRGGRGRAGGRGRGAVKRNQEEMTEVGVGATPAKMQRTSQAARGLSTSSSSRVVPARFQDVEDLDEVEEAVMPLPESMPVAATPFLKKRGVAAQPGMAGGDTAFGETVRGGADASSLRTTQPTRKWVIKKPT